MHELGICDAILKTVDGIAKEEQLEVVNKITLEVGMLSGVVPHFLTDCWQAVIDGTPYQHTALELELINGLARCEDCGHEFSADLEKMYCPKCAGRRLTPLTGTDLTIKEIEAE
ncbi:MAG: hydrogenase maturation nickel metallochaperone HypA [Oscillospiraceae bacterium]|nr:hydrogenase maturation nickel metallochaperone HypA [Oscillospiraceae bacterium]